MKYEYYSLKAILKKDAHYNIIFGERSNGKTYAVLLYALERFVKTGKQLAILRRYSIDFKGKRGQELFRGIVQNGEINRLTRNEWTGVYHYAGMWYLSKVDGKGNVIHHETPFAIGFAITEMEHDKSGSYPNITSILFDEFITRDRYLPNEFVMFQNVLSTIIRLRDDVKIFMCGNSVNKYCPYFKEMGLKHVAQMRQGDIDVYTYGEHTPLRVAVEYAGSMSGRKASNLYFAFNNSRLQMIVNGVWEIGVYPHAPCKWKPADILFTYFIKFDGALLQCEIIQVDSYCFTFIHEKTTPMKHPEKDVIFSLEDSPNPLHCRKINASKPDFLAKIFYFYKTGKVFYQDNDIGEIVRNYLLYCGYGELNED